MLVAVLLQYPGKLYYEDLGEVLQPLRPFFCHVPAPPVTSSVAAAISDCFPWLCLCDKFLAPLIFRPPSVFRLTIIVEILIYMLMLSKTLGSLRIKIRAASDKRTFRPAD